MTVYTQTPPPKRARGGMARLDFDNTAVAFRSRSTLELRKAQLLFRAFAYPTLVQAGPKLVNLALTLRLPVTPLIKTTIFDYFCGGTSIEDCEPVVEQLGRWGIGSILDYSVEGAEREADFERTTAEVLRVIERAASDPSVPFAVFKMTGVGRFGLLEKLSAGDGLTAAETAEERLLAGRIERLCTTAHERGVRIMIDAEETWIQEAIDRYALDMMRRFNKQRPLVYNTVQMYRVDRPSYLERLLATAREEGFHAGVKLVRGAYMEKERERAQRLGLSDPIQPDKAATDRAFDAALQLLLDHAVQVGLVAGSHNEASVRLLAEQMLARGLPADDRRFEFSQLLGMSDNLTYNLADAGFHASKYVPYGPVRAVLPYLFRRAEENSSIQGQAGRELQLIERELARRARER
jgi:proline dehydrogenase